jgi:hypothetical protein
VRGNLSRQIKIVMWNGPWFHRPPTSCLAAAGGDVSETLLWLALMLALPEGPKRKSVAAAPKEFYRAPA